MLVMTAFLAPFRVCFVDDEDVDDWYIVDLIFDVYFYCDILVNFISQTFNNNNQFISTFKDISINYLTGWFIIDFVAIFPFDTISSGGGNLSYNKLFRMLRLPRLYRMTKILKLS